MAACNFEILSKTPLGHRYLVIGAFTNSDGGTGGTVNTTLKERIDAAWIQHIGASVVSDAPSVNTSSFPIKGGSLTIVTVANTSGIFFAVGV